MCIKSTRLFFQGFNCCQFSKEEEMEHIKEVSTTDAYITTSSAIALATMGLSFVAGGSVAIQAATQLESGSQISLYIIGISALGLGIFTLGLDAAAVWNRKNAPQESEDAQEVALEYLTIAKSI